MNGWRFWKNLRPVKTQEPIFQKKKNDMMDQKKIIRSIGGENVTFLIQVDEWV